MKRKSDLRAELEKLPDDELKQITLERDDLKRFTKRANIAYEIQRERHHAQSCLGTHDYCKSSAGTNWCMDGMYHGGYTE